jgi:chlorobactene glucosyltransferase
VSLTLLAAALLAMPLVVLAVRTDRARRRAPPLQPAGSDLPSAGADPKPRVVVFLPARNEQDDVDACLDSLLAQTVTPSIVVVDDGSTDDTARRVALRAHAVGGAPRLVLVSAGPLPAGWRGKVHALAVGLETVAVAGDDWVLTTDADTRHHPELIARALAAAAAERLDAVSLAGSQDARGLGENLLTPAAFALLDATLGDWRRAATAPPVGPGARPVANGQFFLVRRWPLAVAGGFAAVGEAPVDDVALAANLAAQGFRCGFFRAPELLRIRMYRGIRESWRGWRRNLGGLFGRRTKFTPAAIALLLAPPAALALALAAGLWPEAALLWAAGAASSALFRRGSGHAPAWGLLYPIDALLLAAVLVVGTLDRLRGRLASWKGRVMPVGP